MKFDTEHGEQVAAHESHQRVHSHESRQKAESQQLRAKWGQDLISAGWVAFPSTILERQDALGLDAIDINIILQITKHWFEPGALPHPSKANIARAMGIAPRTVQKRLAKLEAVGSFAGLSGAVQREPRGVNRRCTIYRDSSKKRGPMLSKLSWSESVSARRNVTG